MAGTVGEWRQDPFGRHEYRYWNGTQWTEHVADQGRQATDVPTPAPPVPPPPPGSGVVATPSGRLVTATPPRTNGLAVAAMVLGIVWVYWIGSILAVIFGHVAIAQIRGSGGTQRGKGMAIAGLVLGYVGIGLLVVAIVVYAIVGDDDTTRNGNGASEPTGCELARASLSLAEEAYFADLGQYGTELELVQHGNLTRESEAYDVRLLNGRSEYAAIGVGDCASESSSVQRKAATAR